LKKKALVKKCVSPKTELQKKIINKKQHHFCYLLPLSPAWPDLSCIKFLFFPYFGWTLDTPFSLSLSLSHPINENRHTPHFTRTCTSPLTKTSSITPLEWLKKLVKVTNLSMFTKFTSLVKGQDQSKKIKIHDCSTYKYSKIPCL
jgi:hypothetical protein